MMLTVLFALVFMPMAAEAVRSARNERALRAGGAVEPAGDVFATMRIAYPACFVAMLLESSLREIQVTAWTMIGGAVFLAAKGLKYWAISALGPRWTFRVLVPPDAGLVADGPYRFLRHPNYVAVIGELAGMGVMAAAPVTGTIAILAFGALVRARVRVEERALGRKQEKGEGDNRRRGEGDKQEKGRR